MSNTGWIAVDFDGTLAIYNGWKGPMHCGEPVPAMLNRIKRWRADGMEVRIFTARVFPINACILPDQDLSAFTGAKSYRDALVAVSAIREWCQIHIGEVLPITNIKDYGMITLFDDRAVAIEPNTGRILGGKL